MAKIRGAAFVALTLAGCGVAQTLPLGTQGGAMVDGQAVPGELIVQVKPGARFAPQGQVGQSLDLGEAGTFYLTRGQAGQTGSLAKNPDIVGVQPNRFVQLPITPAAPNLPALAVPESNDPLYGKQWYLPHIATDRAWGVTRGKGVVAAVVDTGVDYDHPDLAGNMVSKGKSFAGGKDGKDVFGHGTHVAGIIAATMNNGQGVAGVAPEAGILPVTVLGANGGGNLFAIAGGIKYAADYGKNNKVKVVINLSLGGPAVADPISKAAGWYASGKGALLIAAAGNSSTAVGTPARIKEYFMAVSATDNKDAKANFSNFGPEISVGAPGVDIMNTTPTYDCPLNEHGYAKNYAALRGTSMATPVVAGVAALVWAKNPGWDWKQVRAHLEKTSKDLGTPGHDTHFGHGLVQAGAALGL
ncbi:MAG: S8 family serine peptidase [Candidatus Sericytochromatia bacterium]|nr:S8 family serine peptidase [Candidatus Tanganyikabacteria bacterium]